MTLPADNSVVQPITSGDDIRAFRINRGMSLVQLANEMDISKQTLLKAELGKDLWLKSRKAIADYFNELPEYEDVDITVISIWPDLMAEDGEVSK
jgi:transcriptional regulator with XRE-family HTH domain